MIGASNEQKIDGILDFKEILSNINNNVYKCLGRGSGRTVFDLGNGYVVKAARNMKGAAQNEAEYKISLDDDSGMFAKIACASKNYGMLVMEKAERIRDMAFVYRYFNVRGSWELMMMKELREMSRRHGLALVDFERAANWGQINGRPYIIDYGFTRRIRAKYYSPLAVRLIASLYQS